MPTPLSDEPLQKITINIYAKDYERAKRIWGQGWSSELRALIRDYMEKHHVK